MNNHSYSSMCSAYKAHPIFHGFYAFKGINLVFNSMLLMFHVMEPFVVSLRTNMVDGFASVQKNICCSRGLS
jgi:hypothetical protein